MIEPAASVNSSAVTNVEVLIVGAGFSGICMGIKLLEAGMSSFLIVEKSRDLGGTWWENSYPGARVDVGNHFYCFSFEPSDAWTEFFAQQPDKLADVSGNRIGSADRLDERPGLPRGVGDDDDRPLGPTTLRHPGRVRWHQLAPR